MTLRLKQKIFFIAVLFFFISICISSKVSAKMLKCRLVTGVGDYGKNNQYYYITSSASGEKSRINKSMKMWVNSNGTGKYTPISFLQTSTQKSSIIDFHKGNYYSYATGTIAYTAYYNNSKSVDPDVVNWYWCKIVINSPVFDTLSDFNKTGTVSHEIGHAFGLDHPDTLTKSVMPQLKQKRYVDGPQAIDFDEINKKY